MATGQDVSFLEESSRENPNETISNLGRAGEPISTGSSRASSSPAILELSKEQSRYQDGRPRVPLKERLARSLPQQLSETTPLISRARSEVGEESETDVDEPDIIEHENGEQDIVELGNDEQDNDVQNEVDQVEERGCPRCLDVLEWCMDSLRQFRNSKFILVLPIAFAPLLVVSIIMGIVYADRCRYLAVCGALVGVMGSLFISLWITYIICKARGTPCLDNQKFTICFVFLTLLILLTMDMVLLSEASPSLAKEAKHYCHETYYHFAVGKEIYIVALFVISAVFYLPRFRSCLCCCSCCTPRHGINVGYLSIENLQ